MNTNLQQIEGFEPLAPVGPTFDPTLVPKSGPQRKETENDRARKHGIPKWLKQYNSRYGKGGIEGIVACHLQNPVPMLDNARDRAARRQEYLASEFGMGRREGMAPGCNPEDGFDRVGSIPTPSTTDDKETQ